MLATRQKVDERDDEDDDRCRGTYSIMRWDWICASLWLVIPLGRRILSRFVWIAGHWRSGRGLSFVNDGVLEMPGSYSHVRSSSSGQDRGQETSCGSDGTTRSKNRVAVKAERR